MTEFILTGILQALILSLVAYGVMIPFRLLNFPDLTSEGAYPFAGAVCSSLLVYGFNPILSTIIAVIASGIVGIATASINLRFKINSLLCGIIVTTMIYSINLRLIGKPNVGLFNVTTLFNNFTIINTILFTLLILILFIVPFALFLSTECGLKFRAIGLNQEFCRRKNISITKYTILGLFIANCYTGLSGSLMVQIQNYMDIGMGSGIVIHALAALVIGESIIGTNTLNKQLLSPFIGALIYQQIQGIVLALGLSPSDLKFVTGVVILIVISLNKRRVNVI